MGINVGRGRRIIFIFLSVQLANYTGAINPAQGLSRLTDVIIKLNGRVGRFEGGRELYGCRCNLIRYEAALA